MSCPFTGTCRADCVFYESSNKPDDNYCMISHATDDLRSIHAQIDKIQKHMNLSTTPVPD